VGPVAECSAVRGNRARRWCKGPDSLMTLVRDVLAHDIFEGHLFIFFTPGRDRVRIVYFRFRHELRRHASHGEEPRHIPELAVPGGQGISRPDVQGTLSPARLAHISSASYPSLSCSRSRTYAMADGPEPRRQVIGEAVTVREHGASSLASRAGAPRRLRAATPSDRTSARAPRLVRARASRSCRLPLRRPDRSSIARAETHTSAS
jgi:hypothetical protein